MATFIFTYRQPVSAEVDADAQRAWGTFFELIGPSLVDPGQPVFERTAVGETGDSTKLAGYSVVSADDLDAAVAFARHCPAVQRGGGVEVGVLAELPADHPAAVLKARTVMAAR